MIPGIIASAYKEAEISSQIFTASGTFTVPTGVTKISAVCIGGGSGGKQGSNGLGGGGGGLRWSSSISVTPAESLTITVGAGGAGTTSLDVQNSGSATNIKRSGTTLLEAGGGSVNNGGSGSTISGNIGGGNGGSGGTGSQGAQEGGGGGGTGGYNGVGGNGVTWDSTWSSGSNAPASSSGGGAGGEASTVYGGASVGGGGAGLWGLGADGNASGISGSAGLEFSNSIAGRAWGGGGGGRNSGASLISGSGEGGAIRIMWATDGSNNAYPSTNLTKIPRFINSLTGNTAVNSINFSSLSPQTGDLIYFAAANGKVDPDPDEDDGWETLAGSSTNARLHTYYYIYDGTSTITLNKTLDADQSYIVAVFRNIENSALYPVTTNSSATSATPSTPAMSSVQIGVKNSLLVTTTAIENQLVATAATPPSGWIKAASVEKNNSTSTDGTLVLSYRVVSDTTAISSGNFTGTSTSDFRSYASRFVGK